LASGGHDAGSEHNIQRRRMADADCIKRTPRSAIIHARRDLSGAAFLSGDERIGLPQ
jgi:hypothetical protein